MEINIAMRANEMIEFADKLKAEASLPKGNRTFELIIYAEANAGGNEIVLNFNNDDMEREEMTGRTIVDVDEY